MQNTDKVYDIGKIIMNRLEVLRSPLPVNKYKIIKINLDDEEIYLERHGDRILIVLLKIQSINLLCSYQKVLQVCHYSQNLHIRTGLISRDKFVFCMFINFKKCNRAVLSDALLSILQVSKQIT